MSASSDTADGHPGYAPKVDSAGALARISIGALGVVYGDIGTSPLYALKECFNGPHGVPGTTANVLGVLCLLFWSLTLVVAVKYLGFIMRASNRGEGGILALLALALPGQSERGTVVVTMLGLFGAALLSGESMITPAISVLSAVEGLEVATPIFRPLVLPLTIAILALLFMVQKRGTAGIGAVFGPVTLVWFAVIAVIGARWVIRHPVVLSAIHPIHAVRFMFHHQVHGFLILASIVLCITGAEALYADMGHFGKRPIRVAWYAVVFPSLVINYFGQGALLIDRRGAGAMNPFYELVGDWMRIPLVAIATAATVVASQALISGGFSITQQALQLGYSPRVNIVHTSDEAQGQIYIPEVNRILMVSCIALVLLFRRSSNLAAAYGLAVTGTMTLTSLLFYAVARHRWGWSRRRAGAIVAGFLIIDLSFLAANMAKIVHGGWVPLLIATFVFTLMTTWHRGRKELGAALQRDRLPLRMFMNDVRDTRPYRVKGAAVFMTHDPVGTPAVLLHHYKHNRVLHERVILLSVVADPVPEVPPAKRVDVEDLGEGFHRVIAHYGFMQVPNVPDIVRQTAVAGVAFDMMQTSFYLGRETLLTSGSSGMSGWRKVLFAFMSRNARPATAFFGIPPGRVVELGTQIEL